MVRLHKPLSTESRSGTNTAVAAVVLETEPDLGHGSCRGWPLPPQKSFGRAMPNTLLTALVADIWSAVTTLPGGSLAAEALNRWRGRRLRQAQELLIEELRKGDRHLYEVGEQDEAAAMLFRYLGAAQEGTARLNLRIMAKIMRGLAAERPLSADRFLYYADMIAALRSEEVRALAVLYKHTQARPADEPGHFLERGVAWKHALEELVPSAFDSPDHLEATFQAASRTGLVGGRGSNAGWSDEVPFYTTPLMETITKLAPFAEALAEEGLQT
jgi:hypothetical protein